MGRKVNLVVQRAPKKKKNKQQRNETIYYSNEFLFRERARAKTSLQKSNKGNHKQFNVHSITLESRKKKPARTFGSKWKCKYFP